MTATPGTFGLSITCPHCGDHHTHQHYGRQLCPRLVRAYTVTAQQPDRDTA